MKRRYWLALLFLVAAIFFAGWRRHDTTRVIPGPALQFLFLNDMTWDTATRTMTRTGADPYARVVVAPDMVPLDSVAFEFDGAYPDNEGTFYFFQSPAHLKTLSLGDALPATVTRNAGSFSVGARFDRSNVLRLDLPDFLSHPIKVQRLVLHAPFAAPAWKFGLAVFCAVTSLLLLTGAFLHRVQQRHPWVEFIPMLALVGLKLALAGDVPLSIMGVAAHDDALFVRQASSILDGHWLGDFGPLTLAKGPVFPLFLAAVSWFGLRLALAQAALHALACFALVSALRPLLRSAGMRVLLFAVLLFDPYTFSASTVGRVLRTGIQPALTLLTLAGMAGLLARTQGSLRSLAGWALLAGTGGAAFWFSREEGIWLAPSVVLILGCAAIQVWRTHALDRNARLLLLALPFAIVVSSAWSLRLVNTVRYHAPTTVDVKDGAFPDAYGALLRIEPARFLPGVPVTHEMRLRAYAVSPAFAQLRPQLEGPVGEGWAQFGWEGIDVPWTRKEIRGGWFQWALREAADKAGHYRDAQAANSYWRQVAGEINAACDHGALKAGPRRRGFLPPWNRTLLVPLRNALATAARVAIEFTDFNIVGDPNNGRDTEIALFHRITHERGVENASHLTRLGTIRLLIAQLYQRCGAIAAGMGGVATMLLLFRAKQRRGSMIRMTVLAALAAGTAALIVIVALVDVTSFSATNASYLAPAVPLALALSVLAPYWAWCAWPNGPRSNST